MKKLNRLEEWLVRDELEKSGYRFKMNKKVKIQFPTEKEIEEYKRKISEILQQQYTLKERAVEENKEDMKRCVQVFKLQLMRRKIASEIKNQLTLS